MRTLPLTSHSLDGGGSPLIGTLNSNDWPARTLMLIRALRSIFGATVKKQIH